VSLVSQKDHGELDGRLAPAPPLLDLEQQLMPWLGGPPTTSSTSSRESRGPPTRGDWNLTSLAPLDQARMAKIVAAATRHLLSGEPPACSR
jgi:hypothetical protein